MNKLIDEEISKLRANTVNYVPKARKITAFQKAEINSYKYAADLLNKNRDSLEYFKFTSVDYKYFKNKYNWEVLSELSGNDLLDYFFSNHSGSLIFDIKEASLKSQVEKYVDCEELTELNLPQIKTSSGWKRFDKTMSEKNALEYAESFSNLLILVQKKIENLGNFETVDDYNKIFRYCENTFYVMDVDNPWIMKILHYLYPDILVDAYAEWWQKAILKSLNISPELFVWRTNGQLALLKKHADIRNEMEFLYLICVRVNGLKYSNSLFEKYSNQHKHIEYISDDDSYSKENELLDEEYLKAVLEQEDSDDEIDFSFDNIQPKKIVKIEEGGLSAKPKYKRDPKIGKNVLAAVNHKCAVSANHPSFIKKGTKHAYMELHHLIPMKYQDDFEQSLDNEANVVSLCSNCHNQIHYGEGADELIKKLYHQREKYLKQAGLDITLDDLLKLYGYM